MKVSDFTYLLQHPEAVKTPVQTQDLEELLEAYPYFQAARALHLYGLKNLNSYKYNPALKYTAACTADREVLFDLIEPELGLQPDDDPVTAMEKLAAYLRRVGYVRDIAVRPVSEDEWDYEMLDPVILAGAERLISEGAVPAHISTTLMFALLKKRFGLSAEMIGDPDLRPDGRATERWRLVSSDEP